MPELDEKKRIIAYDTVNDPDENYYALIDNGTAGTGKVSIKGLGPADMISDQYSDSSTYKVGDLCIHNNKLYVCTVAINTPHAFNLSEWELDTLGNYASQIKQSLSNKANKSWTQILNETAPSRNYDQTKNLATGKKFSDFNELMFVMMNANNLRVMGTTVVPIEVFTNGAVYVLGCGDIGATYLYNAVFIYVSDTSTEIAITANSGNPIASYVFRIMAR